VKSGANAHNRRTHVTRRERPQPIQNRMGTFAERRVEPVEFYHAWQRWIGASSVSHKRLHQRHILIIRLKHCFIKTRIDRTKKRVSIRARR
jgi:hypothetical protein